MQPVEIVYRYSSEASEARARPADALAAKQRLDDGNRAFAALFTDHAAQSGATRRVITIDPADLGLTADRPGAPPQHPYAAVLGCADARVPIELVFNEGPNDLFVVRVAGNTLGDDVRGSLDYAIEHLGQSLKLVVVLGHSGCGAVTAAVDVHLDPTGYLALTSHSAVRNLIDRLQVVVHACARRMEAALGHDIVRHPRYREALIELSVVANAALAAHMLQQMLDTHKTDAVRTAYGVYVVEERAAWAPRCGSDEVSGLAIPPKDLSAFGEFSEAVLKSQRLIAILSS